MIYGKPCDQCGQYAALTHRIKSEVLNMLVCYDCGMKAEEVQSADGRLGEMRITLLDTDSLVRYKPPT